MGRAFAILLAERNRHVREFLQRELAQEGYRVQSAGDGREVLMRLEEAALPELLILDLETPFLGEPEIVERLRVLGEAIPIVIHSFPPENATHAALEGIWHFVEKSGDNIQRLKDTVRHVLQTRYPDRFPAGSGQDPTESSRVHPPN